MMRTRTLIAILTVLTGLVLVAGCGSGDSGDASTANSTSAGNTSTGANSATGTNSGSADGTSAAGGASAQFVEEANAACTKSRNQMLAKVKVLQKSASGGSPQAFAAVIVNNVVTPGFEEEVRDLGALDPPPGDSGQVNAIISAIQQMVKQAQSNPLKFTQSEQPFVSAERPATEYGLTACGGLS